MNISELVAQLQALQAKHGDVLVLVHDDWAEFQLFDVSFREEAYVADGTTDTQLPAIVIDHEEYHYRIRRAEIARQEK